MYSDDKFRILRGAEEEEFGDTSSPEDTADETDEAEDNEPSFGWFVSIEDLPEMPPVFADADEIDFDPTFNSFFEEQKRHSIISRRGSRISLTSCDTEDLSRDGLQLRFRSSTPSRSSHRAQRRKRRADQPVFIRFLTQLFQWLQTKYAPPTPSKKRQPPARKRTMATAHKTEVAYMKMFFWLYPLVRVLSILQRGCHAIKKSIEASCWMKALDNYVPKVFRVPIIVALINLLILARKRVLLLMRN